LVRLHQLENDFNHGKAYNYSRWQGCSPKPPSQFFPTEIRPERLQLAVSTLTPLFVDDPILTYLLFTLSDSKRKTYLQAFMTSLLKAAALNGATFLEANNWDSCGVLVHPGRRVDNPFTLLQAGLIPAMCNIGISGIKVRPLVVPFPFVHQTDKRSESYSNSPPKPMRQSHALSNKAKSIITCTL
jgi:hypothetical protein